MSDSYEFTALLNEEDELPLRQWLAAGGARLLRAFSPSFPPEEVEWSSLEQIGRDECLSIWYEDVYSRAELTADYSRDFSGRYFDSWGLPVITYQRQWYWRRAATIFTIPWEASYRSFRLAWPNESFDPVSIAEFESRLAVLRTRFMELREWLRKHCVADGESSFVGHRTRIEYEKWSQG